jgi:hypothetical protein
MIIVISDKLLAHFSAVFYIICSTEYGTTNCAAYKWISGESNVVDEFYGPT